MVKIKPRRILAVLGVVVLLVGGYLGWQVYLGQQMAKQYAANAQKSAQEASLSTPPSTIQTPVAIGNTVAISPGTTTTPSKTSPGTTPSSQVSSSSTSAKASIPQSPSNPTTSQTYKQLMASAYQQTLQAMQDVKSATLALQSRNLSLTAYRSSIVTSQATFSAAETFVRANPPANETLNPSYQEFLAGISLAKQAMSVVLNGISSLSPSSLYAAREMGKQAQQQVLDGYSHF